MSEEKRQVTFTGAQLMAAYRKEEAKMGALQQRMQQLQALFFEASVAEEAVKEIKKAEKNEKIMVDLGAGVYAEAVIDSNDVFKTSLAGSILQNSDSKSTLDYLSKQKENMQKEIAVLEKEQEKTAAAMNELSGILQKGEEQARKRMAAGQDSKGA